MNVEKVKSDLDLGRKIFESIPTHLRPAWGASLLMVFSERLSTPTEIQELLNIVDNERNWKDAHQQFSKIRTFGLKDKKFQPESYLLLGENVAKITYNASGQPAPFDHDAGWWIPGLAITTADYFKSDEGIDEVVRILKIHFKEL
ncbi:MAG: hypothetical protein WDO15_19655 [Bacteroidota bacterium]